MLTSWNIHCICKCVSENGKDCTCGCPCPTPATNIIKPDDAETPDEYTRNVQCTTCSDKKSTYKHHCTDV